MICRDSAWERERGGGVHLEERKNANRHHELLKWYHSRCAPICGFQNIFICNLHSHIPRTHLIIRWTQRARKQERETKKESNIMAKMHCRWKKILVCSGKSGQPQQQNTDKATHFITHYISWKERAPLTQIRIASRTALKYHPTQPNNNRRHASRSKLFEGKRNSQCICLSHRNIFMYYVIVMIHLWRTDYAWKCVWVCASGVSFYLFDRRMYVCQNCGGAREMARTSTNRVSYIYG